MRYKRMLRTGLLLVFAAVLTEICLNVPPKEEPSRPPEEENTVKIEYVPVTVSQNAYRVILEESDRAFCGGYVLDESFLLWLASEYGEDVIMDLAYGVSEGADTEFWYELTGSSIHALWLDYCEDRRYALHQFANVTYRTCSSENDIVMDFIGDINFAEDWMTMQALTERENGIKDCFSADVINEFRSADIFMLNNEFTYSTRGEPLAGKDYTFRADPSRVELLHEFGTDIVSVANNHVYDFGPDALLDTVQTIKDAGIRCIGAGANYNEAKEVQYFVANGKKLAFVTATQIERGLNYTKEATKYRPGVVKTTWSTRFCQIISEAKENSDYVIVYVHWGAEGKNQNDASQTKLARAYVEAGADIIIGGHPHRMQGVEYIDGVPVVYSLGNFWFSDATLYTTIAQVRIADDGTIGLRMIPCVQKDLTASMITDEKEKQTFYQYVADYSTGVGITKDGWIFELSDSNDTENLVYFSGKNYGSMAGNVDLEGRKIDIVGNLKK